MANSTILNPGRNKITNIINLQIIKFENLKTTRLAHVLRFARDIIDLRVENNFYFFTNK